MRERKAYQKENKIKKPAAVEYTATYKAQRSDELLAFLLKKCNTSRNNVKHPLTCRQVLVNGSVVTQHNFPLAKDDEIKIAKHPVKEGQALAANAAKATKKSAGHIRLLILQQRRQEPQPQLMLMRTGILTFHLTDMLL